MHQHMCAAIRPGKSGRCTLACGVCNASYTEQRSATVSILAGPKRPAWRLGLGVHLKEVVRTPQPLPLSC